MFMVLTESSACTVRDTLYIVDPIVAPRLQQPPAAVQLQQSGASPLITASDSVADLRVSIITSLGRCVWSGCGLSVSGCL